jgi:protein-disulfide isomerase
MVFIDLPMGGDMVALAHAMLYAADKSSERLDLMDMYFKNQQYWLLNNSPQSAIVSYAKISGLDVDKVEKTLVNKDFLKKLIDSSLIYVKKLGINGTPFMVISKGKNISVKEDKKLSGALPYEKIATELDEFLKKK